MLRIDNPPKIEGCQTKGHGSERLLIMNKYGYSSAGSIYNKGAKSWEKCEVASEICEEAWKKVADTYHKKGIYDIIDAGFTISKSTLDKSELLAEAVADIFANGDKAETLSKEIANVLKEKLEKL